MAYLEHLKVNCKVTFHVFPIPQYLGNKYKHLDWIGKNIPNDVKTVMDAFAGSQSVSYYLKQRGFKVLANDFMKYSDEIGKSLIENDGKIIIIKIKINII